jgi:hypothetical protein
MIKQDPPNMPLWARYWIILICFPASVAGIYVVILHLLGRLTADLTVLGILVSLTIVFIVSKRNKKDRRRPHSESFEKSTDFTGTIEERNGGQRLQGNLLLSVAEMKCSRCGGALDANDGDVIKNIEHLEQGNVTVKCPICGALSPVPKSQWQRLIRKKKKGEELILFATILSIAGLVCAAGTMIGVVMVFDPGPTMPWVVRIIGGCVFFVGSIATIFLVMQVVSMCNLIRHSAIAPK